MYTSVTIKNYFDALERETCEAAEAGFAIGPRFQRPSSRENKNKTICFKVVSRSVRLVHALLSRQTKLGVCGYVYYYRF